MTLRARRWDLFDLLLEWGADLQTVDVYSVLDTYNVELYERFRSARYDLTAGHVMGSSLGHGTRNRPLLGFAKRHRAEDPKIQTELNIALGYHAREGTREASAFVSGPAPIHTCRRRIPGSVGQTMRTRKGRIPSSGGPLSRRRLDRDMSTS